MGGLLRSARLAAPDALSECDKEHQGQRHIGKDDVFHGSFTSALILASAVLPSGLTLPLGFALPSDSPLGQAAYHEVPLWSHRPNSFTDNLLMPFASHFYHTRAPVSRLECNHILTGPEAYLYNAFHHCMIHM